MYIPVWVEFWDQDMMVHMAVTWVVRVGAPTKIFKPHSQISRLGMWTICFLTIFLGNFMIM